MHGVSWWVIVVVCLASVLAPSPAEARHHLTPQRLRRGNALIASKRNEVIQAVQDATKTEREQYQAALAARHAVAQKKYEQLAAARTTTKDKGEKLFRTLMAPPPGTTVDNVTADDLEKSSKDPDVVAARTAVEQKKAALDAAAAKAASAPAMQPSVAEAALSSSELTTAAETGNPPAAPPSLFSSAPLTGTSWQTAVASGLAQFLAERANEELAVWLAGEIAGRICDTNKSGGQWQPRDLFPATCKVVEAQSGATLGQSDPSQLGGLLASALRTDLEALPFVVLGKFVGADAASIEVTESLFLELRGGVAPLPLIAGLASDPTLQAACAGGKTGSVSSCILIGLGEVVGALGDVAEAPDATANAQIQALATAEAKAIQTKLCGTGTTCDSDVVAWLKLLGDPTVLGNVGSALQQLFTDARNLYQTVETWKKSSAQDTATLLSRAGDVINGVDTLIDDTMGVLQAPWAAGGAANVTCPPNDALCPKVAKIVTSWHDAEPAASAAADALKGQYADAAREVLIFAQDNASMLKLPPQMVQYIGFAVDVSQAKTASDVKGLLENAAAPVGTWRLKRQKDVVFSVTSLVGGAGGFEKPTSVPSSGLTVQGYGGAYAAGGVMASVGLDLSVHMGKGWTIGPYVSVIDVGQLVSTPLNPGGSSTAQPQAGGEISLAQVLAPGAFLRLGLGNTPFTIGAGATYAPSLRKFEHVADAGSDEVSVIRAQAFLAMDLTLFPIASAGDTNPSK